MRLHHGVALIGRRVALVEFHRRRLERTLEVADAGLRRSAAALAAIVPNERGVRRLGGEVELARLGLVVDADQVGRGPGLLEGLRDHHGDRLVVMLNDRSAEQVGGIHHAALQPGHVERRDDRQNAWRRLGLLQVHGSDAAFGDRRSPARSHKPDLAQRRAARRRRAPCRLSCIGHRSGRWVGQQP